MGLIQPISDDPRFQDLTGHRFGHLFVVGYAGQASSRKSRWHCICRCGMSKIVTSDNLKSGTTYSCGCGHGLTMREYLLSHRIVDQQTSCWLWTGTGNGNGYGIFMYRTVVKKAARASYEAFVGPIGKGMCLAHTCDRPICINPKHLWLATNAENSKDMVMKGRSTRGEAVFGAKLTEADVIQIRQLAAYGCSRDAMASYFSVDKGTIGHVIRRNTWKHVD